MVYYATWSVVEQTSPIDNALGSWEQKCPVIQQGHYWVLTQGVQKCHCKGMRPDSYSSSIYHSQTMEASQVPTTRCVCKEDVVCTRSCRNTEILPFGTCSSNPPGSYGSSSRWFLLSCLLNTWSPAPAEKPTVLSSGRSFLYNSVLFLLVLSRHISVCYLIAFSESKSEVFFFFLNAEMKASVLDFLVIPVLPPWAGRFGQLAKVLWTLVSCSV